MTSARTPVPARDRPHLSRAAALIKVRPRLISGVSALALMMGSSAAFAQTQPTPPQRYTLDERGVDLVTGQFNHVTQEVVIGDPAQGGLVYGRVALNQGWRDLAIGGVTCSNTQCVVSYEGVSEIFNIDGQTYVPLVENGATLVRNSGAYVHTSRDGTVATMTDRAASAPYSEESLLSSIVRPDGGTRTFNYKTSQPCGATCPPGTAMRLQSVQSNRGYQIHYEYEANNFDPNNGLFFKVKRVVGINSAVQYCSPTADSCPSTGENWPSVAYSYASDGSNGSFETATDQLGRQTRYHLDIQGQLDAIRLPGRQTDQIAVLRTNGQVTQAFGPTGAWAYGYSGNLTTANNISYGPQGQQTQVQAERATLLPTLVTQVYDDGSGLGQFRSWQYQYTVENQLSLIVEPEGNATLIEYDARGNATQVTQRSKDQQQTIVSSATYAADCQNPKICNQPTSTTDGRGNTTEYTYDPNHGGLTSVTQPAPTPGGIRPQLRMTYGPQAAWTLQPGQGYVQQSPVTLPLATSTCATQANCAGTADEIVSAVTYQVGSSGQGSNALPAQMTQRSGDSAVQSTIAMTYDADGDVTTVDGPLPGSADTTRYLYDDLRRPVGTIGPDPDQGGALRNRAMRMTYNPDGSVGLQEVGTTVGQTNSAWSAFQSLQQVVTLYDIYVRPTHTQLQAGGTVYSLTHMGYDGSGRTICVAQRMNPAVFSSNPGPCLQNAEGPFGPDRITRMSYGPDNAVLSVTTADGTPAAFTEQLTYRPSGNINTLIDGKGNVSTLGYDGFDRPSRTTYPLVPGQSQAAYEEVAYDAASNVVSYRTRNNQIFATAYDALNRPTLATNPANVGNVQSSYDLLGRPTSMAYPGGASVSMTWDALNRQTSETDSRLGTSLMQYDPAGRRTRLTWPDGFFVTYGYDLTDAMTSILGNGTSAYTAYAYDDLGRRIRLDRGNGVTTRYTYDPADRMTLLEQDLPGTTNDQSLAFTYNPAGAIATRARSNPIYDMSPPLVGSNSYPINALNQTGVDGTPLPYDLKGNLLGNAQRAYTYDQANRLRSVTPSGGSTSTLSYDPLSRLSEMVGTQGAWYLYDGVEISGIASVGGTSLINRVVRGPWADEVAVVFPTNSTPLWNLQDERGSTIATTNPAGSPTALLAYDDYGNQRAGNTGRFQYSGQLWLPDFQLYHYKARAYDPSLGRFMQPDPVGFAVGMNLYGYVRSDPINFVDPLGLDPLVIGGTTTEANCIAERGRVGQNASGQTVCFVRSNVSAFRLGWEWLSGTGPENRFFSGGSVLAQALMTAPDIQRGRCVINSRAKNNDGSASYTDVVASFGLDDVLTANTWMEQYTGSYNYSAVAYGGSTTFTAQNRSSVTSLLYGSLLPSFLQPPNWSRSSWFKPMSNTYQTYQWTEPTGNTCEN